MLHDLKFAFRLLKKDRGFAATAVLTLALGAGANTAIFSIADAVLFRPLPYPNSDRLFMLRKANLKTGEIYGRMPPSNFDAARATGLFDAFTSAPGFAIRTYVRENGALNTLSLAAASLDYLDMIGVKPAIDRSFAVQDGRTRAVILSHRTWMTRYGGNAGIVGKFIEGADHADQPLHIVGVLEPRFRSPVIAGNDGFVLMRGTFQGAPPMVRLKRTISIAAAQAQLNALRGEELEPGTLGFRLVPLREDMARRQDRVLWLLLAASGIVLAVACVNLANLLIAHGRRRARELAIRLALGASPRRLVRLLLIESGVISIAGAGLGILLAYVSVRVLANQLPPLLAMVTDPRLDARSVVFAAACALLTTVAFGVWPSWRLSRTDARTGLTAGQLQVHAPRRGRQTLVIVETAMCLALLCGAALVGRSLLLLLSDDVGFAARRIVVNFELPTAFIRTARSSRVDTAAQMRFLEVRLQDVRNQPGVRASGAVSVFPFSGAAPDLPLFDTERDVTGGIYFASAGYFRAIAVTFARGRDFTDAESFSAAPVAIVNETAARLLFGTTDCIGRIVTAPRQSGRTIVGVVKDIRQSFRLAPMPAMYVPFDQSQFRTASIVVEADDTPANRERLRDALSTSPDALIQTRSMADGLESELAPFRFNALVVGAFAALTLALVIVGVYSVIAALVGERTREYAIRLAIGATRERLYLHVLREAIAPIGVGIAIGLAIAASTAHFLESQLYDVRPLDLTSFICATALVLISSLAATTVPARRPGLINPIDALHAD